MAFLSVGKLPATQTYTCKDGTVIDMGDVINGIKPLIRTMSGTGLIDDNKSFGFAMMPPVFEDDDPDDDPDWDDPLELVWFTGGWGADRFRYIANAVRKLRPLARDGEQEMLCHWSTLDIVFDPASKVFQNPVPSQTDEGLYPWGDFPHGGAVVMQFGPLTLTGACSAFHQIDDDTVTRVILGTVGKRIVIGDGLLPVAA
jgi:hypothetical protein